MPPPRCRLAGGSICSSRRGKAPRVTALLSKHVAVKMRHPRALVIVRHAAAVSREHPVTRYVGAHPKALAANVDPIDAAEAYIAIAARGEPCCCCVFDQYV